MIQPWAICMRLEDAASLSGLRLRAELEVCERSLLSPPKGRGGCGNYFLEGPQVWLRDGSAEADIKAICARIQALPGVRFLVLPAGQLIPQGCLTPRGYLPDGPWVRLSEWLSVEVDAAALSGLATAGIPLRIVRGGSLAEANVLLTMLDAWRDYAVQAPKLRLDQWSFAMSSTGKVVVRGKPLPALPGAAFVESQGVAMAAGCTWTPPVDPCIVRSLLKLQRDDLALLHAGGGWDLLRGGDFVRATRLAVRSSMGSAADE